MKHLIILIALISGLCIHAQEFNGTIEFKSSNAKDTTRNIYLVKVKQVKLEHFNKKTGGLEGSFIFDLTQSKITWINPQRKVWGEHKSETPPVIRGECEIIKGSGTKSVAGIKCKEYVVKNVEENTKITYWIADGKFTFFSPLVKLWNRKDKQSVYFTQIKDLPEGAMPLLSEEVQLTDNKPITKLEVIKISNKAPDDTRMGIPSNYTKLD